MKSYWICKMIKNFNTKSVWNSLLIVVKNDTQKIYFALFTTQTKFWLWNLSRTAISNDLKETNLLKSGEFLFRFRRVDWSLDDIMRTLVVLSIWFWPLLLLLPPALFWWKLVLEEAFGMHNCCWWPCWSSNSARSQVGDPEPSAIC